MPLWDHDTNSFTRKSCLVIKLRNKVVNDQHTETRSINWLERPEDRDVNNRPYYYREWGIQTIS